jgi:PAS domain S-box-containing protein
VTTFPRAVYGRLRSFAHVGRWMGLTLSIAIAYVLAAQVGFWFAFAAEQITTVWPPSGIAIGALLLWGMSFWPAVWIGAFIANAGAAAPIWTAAAVATGNTLEAVAAAWLLRDVLRFDERLRRVPDVVAFIMLAAGASTMLSATIGVATLCIAAVQPWSRFWELWGNWWLGDAVGALVVAPVVLTTLDGTRWLRGRWAEAGVLITGAIVATFAVFSRSFEPTIGHQPLQYVTFAFVIAAAVRHGQPATAYVVLGTSAVAVWNTVLGAGPFAGAEILESLIVVQVFMGVLAGTGLLLSAAISERHTGERRRAATYAVGEVLASASDLPTAGSVVLRAIGESLEWTVAALWVVDTRDQVLRCMTIWTERGSAVGPFATTTMNTALQPGVGLAGRVWSTGQPAWVRNIVEDRNSPRAAVARESGLHGGFGVPVGLGDEIFGVIECFHSKVLDRDPELLRIMATVGHQVGQFIGRKREETAVSEEQRRTSAILHAALDAVIGMDHRGVITHFNAAAVRTFGYSSEEAVGRDLAELLIPLSLRENHREGLARYLVTGEGPFLDTRVETTGYHADGHEFPIEVAIVRVPDEEPPHFTGFVRDLSARKNAEREREGFLVREANARRDAETANRAKDEFLATLSHELRTPLNAIVGWTRMLLDGSMDPRSTKRALEVIDRNAHLQSQLVADILDVSRIITGGLRLDMGPVDVAAVIGAALDAVRPAADAKKVHLRTRLMGPRALVQGDAQRLQQVVWNLLSNAVKFTPTGGTVAVEVIGEGGAMLLRVRDDGAGIEPEFLPFVFERFRQADSSASRQHGGLGLGLAIVRHLVELHGGTVRAESAGKDKGATFTVELPRLDVPDAVTWPGGGDRRDTLDAVASSTLSGYRILVVDDEEDARDLAATILESAGAEVQTASSVADALEKLDAGSPDALLADIGMPGADGYTLIREVRSREMRTGLHLPVAAITAYAGERDRARVMAAGFDRHVPKPISRSSIVTAVLAICQDRSQRA